MIHKKKECFLDTVIRKLNFMAKIRLWPKFGLVFELRIFTVPLTLPLTTVTDPDPSGPKTCPQHCILQMLILTHLVPLKFQQKQQQEGEEHSAQHGSETSSFLREKCFVLKQEYKRTVLTRTKKGFLLTRFHAGSLWVVITFWMKKNFGWKKNLVHVKY